MTTRQDTGKYRTNTNDQFYTNEDVAKQCFQWIITALNESGETTTTPPEDYIWIEPSAGTGAFLHQLPESFTKIGLDIEPKAADIIKQDYLSWNPTSLPKKDVIVFGNPHLAVNLPLLRRSLRKVVRLRISLRLFYRSHLQNRVCIVHFIRGFILYSIRNSIKTRSS